MIPRWDVACTVVGLLPAQDGGRVDLEAAGDATDREARARERCDGLDGGCLGCWFRGHGLSITAGAARCKPGNAAGEMLREGVAILATLRYSGTPLSESQP